MNTCAIYTVTDPSGACLYVGSTANPQRREAQHKIRFPNGLFSVIEMVSASERHKAEKAAILKFRNGGHAIQNIVLPSDADLINKIKTLRIGKSFVVESESERTQALNIAKILGKRSPKQSQFQLSSASTPRFWKSYPNPMRLT